MSTRMYRYVIRAESQPESAEVHIWHNRKKSAIAEFRRNHPEFEDQKIVARKFNEHDRYREKMDQELQ